MPTVLERLNAFKSRSVLDRLNAFKEQPPSETDNIPSVFERLQSFKDAQLPPPAPPGSSLFETLRNAVSPLIRNKPVRALATGGATLPFDYPQETQQAMRGLFTPEVATRVAEMAIPRLKGLPGETIGEKLSPEIPPERFKTPFQAGLHTFTSGMLRDIANIYATPASYFAPKVAEIAGETAFGALPEGAQKVLTTPISKLFQTRSPVKIADRILNAGSFDEALNLWKTVDQDIRGAVGRVIYRRNPNLAVRFTVGEPESVIPLGLPAPGEVGKTIVPEATPSQVTPATGPEIIQRELLKANKGRTITPDEEFAQVFVTNQYPTARQFYLQRVKDEYKSDVARVVSGDVGKFSIPGMDKTKSVAYHEAGSALSKSLESEWLNDPATKDKDALFMAGGSGSGKSFSVRLLSNELGGGIENYALVYDTNLNNFASAVEKIDRVLATGRKFQVDSVYQDPVTAFKEGVIPRIETRNRLVRIEEHIDTHLGFLPTVMKLMEKYGNKGTFKFIYNPEKGKPPQILPLDKIPIARYTRSELETKLYGVAQDALQSGQIDQETFRLLTEGIPTSKEGKPGRGGAYREERPGEIQTGLAPRPRLAPSVPQVIPQAIPTTTIPTPKGKLTLFPRKTQLLLQIQNAITKAPDVKIDERTGKYPEGTPTVSFKIDGGANIFNTKDALTKFHEMIKKTPESAVESHGPKLVLEPRSVAGKKEEFGLLRPVEGKGYFTDGKMIIEGEPPKSAKYVEGDVGKLPLAQVKEQLNKKTNPATLKYYFTNTEDITSGEGVSPYPVPQIDPIVKPKALFESQGKYYAYNQFKFNAIRNRFPDAKYGISSEGSLIAYTGGKPRAVLMPIQISDKQMEAFVKTPPLSGMAKQAGILKSKLGQSGQLNIALLPGATEAAQFSKDLGESFNAILRPYAIGSVSKETAGILRENIGVMVRNLDIVEKSLNTARQAYDKRPNESNIAFIDRVEKGEIHADPMDTQVSKQWRAISDKDVKDVQDLGTGKLENFIENYFPHIWKDPQKAVDAFRAAASKRPFEGGKAFLKQRTIPTVSEGIALGLEPVSYNPVDLMLLKHREVQKYVMAHRTLNTLKEEGIAKFIRLGQEIPEGYRKIDDRIATVYSRDEEGQLILRGNYYAQQDAARIINNYLSPGLRGNFLYDVYRGTGNSLNQFQLGLSAFHLGFTSMDATISKFALALEKVYYGHIISGLKDVSMVPFSPITNIIQGDRLLRAWYGNPKNELEAKIADYMAIAGGRAQMDKFYATTFTERFKENLKTGKLVGALVQVPFAIVEQSSRPILEWIVPRQKLGVFMDMVKFELEKNPTMSHEQLRQTMQNAWDSVDNRMGQLVYDNLFWNKITKDLAMASVRSVGWNLGTLREIGGGVGEAGNFLGDLLKGRRSERVHKFAYVLALPVIVGLYGAIYQYLRTGELPQELKDYYFPRNGRIDKNGDPARDSLPTYVKDIYHYFKHPVRTALNKLNPINAALYQMMVNKDFYGTKIRNEDDPFVRQLADEIKYIGTQFIPFGIRNVQRAVRPDLASKTLPFVGIVPAPYDINQTPAEEKAYEIMRARMPIGGRTREQAEKAKMKAELRNNYSVTKDETPLRSAMQSGTISYQEYNAIKKGAKIPVLERLTTQMTYQEVGELLKVANPDERAILIPILQRKINNKLMDDISREQRMEIMKSRDALLNITDSEKKDLAQRRLRQLIKMQKETVGVR